MLQKPNYLWDDDSGKNRYIGTHERRRRCTCSFTSLEFVSFYLHSLRLAPFVGNLRYVRYICAKQGQQVGRCSKTMLILLSLSLIFQQFIYFIFPAPTSLNVCARLNQPYYINGLSIPTSIALLRNWQQRDIVVRLPFPLQNSEKISQKYMKRLDVALSRKREIYFLLKISKLI